MSKRKKYRTRNWREYNKALVNRGSLTLWFDEKSINEWYSVEPTGRRGRSNTYSDAAILCCLTLRTLFHLPLRATQGFVTSLIELLQLPLKAPNYSVLSKRQSTLSIPEFNHKSDEPLHLVVDSTGIKIFGEGEWKMRQHGKEKRRTWRKLHVGVNEKTQEIVMSAVTTANTHDCEVLPKLLSRTRNIKIQQVTGDGAYDTNRCYQAVLDAGGLPCFPPRIVAARHKPINTGVKLRNQAIGYMRRNKLHKWKEKANYHRRNLAETAMWRLKKIFGEKAASRLIKNQTVELTLRCHMLNRMTALGMPDTVCR